ncbi:MAG: 3-oxoadipate enol-lactonase [Deltaproteobacteria bacterium RBG_16_50_11]|nr:MAG: 3-oxoadipate enol-lactonase [Deltaproteobacteria bacterium RBG_16_50_11]
MLIRANGIQMNYEVSGKKKAPVVMLSHSLGCSLAMWDPQLGALEPLFQVLRYDIRGHGRSETPPGPYKPELLAKDAIALLDGLGIDKVHWVGVSMGGMIGQSVGLNRPDRLKSLALCDTTGVIPPEAQILWRERIAAVHEKGIESQLESTLERYFTPSFLKANPPMLGAIRKQFLATPVEGYLGCVEAIRSLNYLDRLSEIKIPTLIMVGEDDPGTPVSASEAMHKRISNSKLVIIPSARHLPNLEQPEFFNTSLLTFLKGL